MEQTYFQDLAERLTVEAVVYLRCVGGADGLEQFSQAIRAVCGVGGLAEGECDRWLKLLEQERMAAGQGGDSALSSEQLKQTAGYGAFQYVEALLKVASLTKEHWERAALFGLARLFARTDYLVDWVDQPQHGEPRMDGDSEEALRTE